MTSFLSFHRQKGLKAKNVIMTRHNDVKLMSDCKFMFVYELSDPKLVFTSNFSSISLQMVDFSLFFGAKSCKAPSAMATA